MRLSCGVCTDTGRIRENNEDNFYLDGRTRENVAQGHVLFGHKKWGRRLLAAVCDGMGGEEQGELASLLAVRALAAADPSIKKGKDLEEAFFAANRAVCEEIRKNGGQGMGSTMTALLIKDGAAFPVNLGDSRIYLFRKGSLMRLTTDHSRAEVMRRAGLLTEAAARTHPGRYVLTRYLGVPEEELAPEPERGEQIPLRRGDIFLLCSDGLTDMLPDTEIARILSKGNRPEKQAEVLVEAALACGGRDNVTVAVIRVCL